MWLLGAHLLHEHATCCDRGGRAHVAVLQSYKEKKIKEKQAADADAAGF